MLNYEKLIEDIKLYNLDNSEIEMIEEATKNLNNMNNISFSDKMKYIYGIDSLISTIKFNKDIDPDQFKDSSLLIEDLKKIKNSIISSIIKDTTFKNNTTSYDSLSHDDKKLTLDGSECVLQLLTDKKMELVNRIFELEYEQDPGLLNQNDRDELEKMKRDVSSIERIIFTFNKNIRYMEADLGRTFINNFANLNANQSNKRK